MPRIRNSAVAAAAALLSLSFGGCGPRVVRSQRVLASTTSPPGATEAEARSEGAATRPRGAARVDFASTSRSMRWKVAVEDQPICVTPCTLWLGPGQWVTLRTNERRPIRIEVGAVGGAPTRVVAKPLSNGMYATGVTFTSLGGVAVVTGVALSSVGCFSDRDGLCTAGAITGVAGAVVTVGAIWLMRRALPKVWVDALTGAP